MAASFRLGGSTPPRDAGRRARRAPPRSLLSVAQMIQDRMGVLPMADTTWAQYTELFLKFR